MSDDARMTTIFLVRHGQTTANRDQVIAGFEDSPLTEEGRAQVRSLAGLMAGIRIDVAFTSTLSRAYKSCEEILRGRDMEAVRLDDLREQHFGKWEGMKVEDVMEQEPDLLMSFKTNPLRSRPTGGENLMEFAERVKQVFRTVMIPDNHGKNILCVCHGGVVRMALCYLLDLDLDRHAFRFDITNASLTVVRYGSFGHQLLALGLRDPGAWKY